MDYFIIFAIKLRYEMAKLSSGFPGERAIVVPVSIINEFKTNELGKLLYITDIGFYPKAGLHYRRRTAVEAQQYILLYCTEGNGWIENGENNFKLSSGEAIILPKAKPHTYGSNPKSPWSIYWIHFEGLLAPYFSKDLERPLLINPGKDSRIGDRLELFEDIFTILKNGYSKFNLDYSVTVLFHFLGSLKYMNAFRCSLSERQSKREMTEDAIHFMRENLQNPLKLKEIAHYTGLSASHFSMLFKQKTGYTPLSYFNQLRLQSACHQLDFSTLSITQIAKTTGFDDPLYFSRLFSKIMGCSPSNYRKRKKG